MPTFQLLDPVNVTLFGKKSLANANKFMISNENILDYPYHLKYSTNKYYYKRKKRIWSCEDRGSDGNDAATIKKHLESSQV